MYINIDFNKLKFIVEQFDSTTSVRYSPKIIKIEINAAWTVNGTLQYYIYRTYGSRKMILSCDIELLDFLSRLK